MDMTGLSDKDFRDMCACAAMQLDFKGKEYATTSFIVTHCFNIADAMVAERARRDAPKTNL